MYDKVDGGRLFSPRLKQRGRRNLDKPIEDHLNAYKQYYKDNKETTIRENDYKFKKQAKLRLCAKSSEILAGSFVNNLSEMFSVLGGDSTK